MLAAASPRFSRLRGAWVAAAIASLSLAGLACACSAAPPPKPSASDPGEQLIASLTEALKLDVAQQQKTRDLMKAMADRDDRIRAGWANGERVRPELLAASHGQFQSDFLSILTEEQRRIFVENRTRLILKTRAGQPGVPH